jgi:hypothetical protein
VQRPHFSAAAFGVNYLGHEQEEAQRRQDTSAQSTTVASQHAVRLSSERERFPNLGAPKSAVNDFMEKSKKIGEIDPKSAIQAASVKPPIHERVVPLNHHEAFTL